MCFQILRRVSETSYKIELPEGSIVHLVFHVSMIRQAQKTGTPVSSSLPSGTDAFAVTTQKVLATQLHKKANQVVSKLDSIVYW